MKHTAAAEVHLFYAWICQTVHDSVQSCRCVCSGVVFNCTHRTLGSINVSAVEMSHVLMVWGPNRSSGNGSLQKFVWFRVCLHQCVSSSSVVVGVCTRGGEATSTLLVIRNNRA